MPNSTENPMILDYRRSHRYREVIDDELGERYIVDEDSREMEPGLLREGWD